MHDGALPRELGLARFEDLLGQVEHLQSVPFEDRMGDGRQRVLEVVLEHDQAAIGQRGGEDFHFALQ